MRFRFSRRRRKTDPDARRSAREQLGKARGGRPRAKQRPEPPTGDPIKNWESPDQQFLRQAGDPFIDG